MAITYGVLIPITSDGLTVDNAIQSLTATETQPFRLTGTLNQAVNKTITLFVTDSEGRKSFCNLTFNIVSVLEFITLALPDALKNTPYSESIPVKGGIAPYTFTMYWMTGLAMW
jgi:hypothetical protein